MLLRAILLAAATRNPPFYYLGAIFVCYSDKLNKDLLLNAPQPK